MRQLKAPSCHWGGCPGTDKTMFLLNETADFWFFAHGCGTTRAVTKPAARAIANYQKYVNSTEQERQLRRYLESHHREYSIPEVKK